MVVKWLRAIWSSSLELAQDDSEQQDIPELSAQLRQLAHSNNTLRCVKVSRASYTPIFIHTSIPAPRLRMQDLSSFHNEVFSQTFAVNQSSSRKPDGHRVVVQMEQQSPVLSINKLQLQVSKLQLVVQVLHGSATRMIHGSLPV